MRVSSSNLARPMSAGSSAGWSAGVRDVAALPSRTVRMFDPIVSRARPGVAAPSPPTAVVPERVLEGERARTYDAEVLVYVAQRTVVTLHQVMDRISDAHGIGPAYVGRVVRLLVRARLLRAERLEGGVRMRELLELTPAGHRVLQLPPLREPARWRRALRPYRLQFADMLLQRGADGFDFVSVREAFPHLHRWALRRFAGRSLNSHEAQDHYHLKRLPPYEPGLPLLVGRAGDDVRLVLPARPGLDPRSVLASIPPMPFHPPAAFEIVCASADIESRHLERAIHAVRRWSARRRQPAVYHLATPWEARTNPARRGDGT